MNGQVVSINGIGLYHEVHGTGRPLIVLHGGVLNADTCFGAMIPRLAEVHQVIAVDLQGHGHTADTDRPHAQLLNHRDPPGATHDDVT